jgi:hypothetical protein
MKRIAVACAVVMAAASSLGATAAAPEGGILEKNKAVARQFLEEAFGPQMGHVAGSPPRRTTAAAGGKATRLLGEEVP